MLKLHGIASFLAIGLLSMSMLGQSEACNVNAVIRVFTPPGQGPGMGMGHMDDKDDPMPGPGIAPNVGAEIRLEADLMGTGIESGNADFRARGTRRSLKVELEDAPVGSVHSVLIDGKEFGTLTIGSLGQGEVEFDTNVEPGHAPWPEDLPFDLPAGTVIQAGPVSGMLVAKE